MAEISDEQIARIAETAVRSALSQTTRLSREDASDLVKAAAVSAANEVHIRLFADLGYDLANIEDKKRFRRTLGFSEGLMLRSAGIGRAVTNAVAVAICLGLISLIILGTKMTLGSWRPPPSSMMK